MRMRGWKVPAYALVLGAMLTACVGKASDPRAERFAALPDWRGVWQAEGQDAGISGFGGGLPDLIGVNAPWNETAKARLDAVARAQGGRKATGWGYPLMMSCSAPLQFLITPDETLIVNMYRDVRHVYTDGRDHPAEADRWATTWGDSVGRWEGDTLVIDTLSVAEPLKFFFFAPPLTERAHYIERLRKVGPDRIESEVTIEDPETLTRPWVTKLAYVRQPRLDRMIHDDFVNDRSELQNGEFTIAPSKQ